jgi:hypothetical protein
MKAEQVNKIDGHHSYFPQQEWKNGAHAALFVQRQVPGSGNEGLFPVTLAPQVLVLC